MEPVMIDDPDKAKITVNELIAHQPDFVVVISCGENLGKENGRLHQVAVGTKKELYVFNLDKNTTLMNDGQLKELLMNKEITKVFCGIQEISSSLIMEYDILMNGIPIWDLEILYDKMSGQMTEKDKDTIKEMGFHKKYFKKWAKKSLQPGTFSAEDTEELKQQAALMMRMYTIFQKRMLDPITNVMIKETYERAIPKDGADFLCKKIEKLKVEMKEKEKRAETKKEEQASSGIDDGKTTGGKDAAEEVNMEPVMIDDPDKAKITVNELIEDKPDFVVVIHCGENLGEENGHLHQVAVGTRKELYVFNLDKNTTLMNDGQLKELLMNKEITKILHDKLSGQMSEIDKDTIKEMGFHKKYFKKWAKRSEQPWTISEEDMEELKQQAAIMMKMYTIFQKQMSGPITKVMKKETYERAIPNKEPNFLCVKIERLKVEMKEKEKEKKEKAETKTEGQATSGKCAGKTNVGKGGKNKKKK